MQPTPTTKLFRGRGVREIAAREANYHSYFLTQLQCTTTIGPALAANVRADGFFSVQVIAQALQNAGLSCTPIGSEEARDAHNNPQNETAFICNRSEHWLAIRKLGGHWFDLNR
jgi:hypothetical protein